MRNVFFSTFENLFRHQSSSWWCQKGVFAVLFIWRKKSVFEKRTVVATKWSWQNFRYQFQSGNLEIFQYERKFCLIRKASRIRIWKWFGYSLSFQFLANTSISLLQIFFIKWAWRTTPIKKSSFTMLTLLQISERKISFFVTFFAF